MSAQIVPQNSTEVQQTSAHISSTIKADSCKAPLGLIPRSALIEEAHVLAYGAEKYDLHNWRKGMEWTRLIDAILRHVTSFADGEDFDQESGLHHLAHARASCGFLLEYMESHPELDNRHRHVGKKPSKFEKKVEKVKKAMQRRDKTPSPGEVLTELWRKQQDEWREHERRGAPQAAPFYNSPYGD